MLPHRSFALFLLFATSVARAALPLNHNDTEFSSPDPNLNLTKREPSGTYIELTVGKEDTTTGYPLAHWGPATIGTTGRGRIEGLDFVHIRCNFLLSSSKLVVSHDSNGQRFKSPPRSTAVIEGMENTITFTDYSWYDNIISLDAFTVGGFTIPKVASDQPPEAATQYYANVYDFFDPTHIDASTCGMAFADSITFEGKLPEAANSLSWIYQMYNHRFITPQFVFDLRLGRPIPLMYLGTSFNINTMFRRHSYRFFQLNSRSKQYQYDTLALSFDNRGTIEHTAVTVGVFDNGCPMILLNLSLFEKVISLLKACGVSSAELEVVPDEEAHAQGKFIGYDCMQPLPRILLTFMDDGLPYYFPFQADSLAYSVTSKKTSAAGGSPVIKRCILPFELSKIPGMLIGMPLFLSQIVGFTFARGHAPEIFVGGGGIDDPADFGM